MALAFGDEVRDERFGFVVGCCFRFRFDLVFVFGVGEVGFALRGVGVGSLGGGGDRVVLSVLRLCLYLLCCN